MFGYGMLYWEVAIVCSLFLFFLFGVMRFMRRFACCLSLGTREVHGGRNPHIVAAENKKQIIQAPHMHHKSRHSSIEKS
jgi:hypothetical protein